MLSVLDGVFVAPAEVTVRCGAAQPEIRRQQITGKVIPLRVGSSGLVVFFRLVEANFRTPIQTQTDNPLRAYA